VLANGLVEAGGDAATGGGVELGGGGSEKR
jgi:hypothetical protein